MAFTGLSFDDAFSADLVQRDVSRIIATLSPKEVPILDFLGDADVFAQSVKHEYVQDLMFPHYIVASTAVNSATAATALQVNGLGLALTVGTILENESAAPEVMQVSSIVGANSIVVSRNYDGSGVGSLAAGGQLYVREQAGKEGADHDGEDTRRLGAPAANTVGLFRIPLSISKTQLGVSTYGNDTWEARKAKGLIEALNALEKAVVRGKLNSANSLATSTTTRTMKGIRDHISTVNSTVAAASFAANPHLYIGNVWQQAWKNGASETETWAILAGATFYRDISNLNDTKVQDSNISETFKRRIRTYVGPMGDAQVELCRVLPDTELLLVPKERVKVVPLQGRSFRIDDMAVSGDNVKSLIVGEYTIELHHESAMARLRV